MKKILFIFAALILITSTSYFLLLKKKDSQKSSLNTPSHIAPPLILLTGRVVLIDKTPAGGFTIFAGNTSGNTNSDGTYTLPLPKSGIYPLYFMDLETHTFFHLANTYEQSIYIKNGNNKLDFTIEKAWN